jgi:hypothetical protein
MKKITTSILFLLLALSAVAAYTTTHKKKKKKINPIQSTTNKTKIKSVLMGRSACFGTCPSYTLEIFETGLIRYNGKSYVDKMGIYEKKISPNEAIQFITEFNAIQPDTLHYLYETKIADLPGIYYFISYQDSVKRILNADAGPRILYDWSKKFDSFAHFDASWKKQATSQP